MELSRPFFDSAERRRRFLQAMRTVANSVAVVTTQGEGGRAGATVSSFTSVSADPPKMLVCLRSDSTIAQAVEKNRKFAINVLPSREEALSVRFAGGDDERVGDRFEGIEERFGNRELPLLENASWFLCEVEQSVTCSTHDVVIGRLLEVNVGEVDPLVYLDGAYSKALPPR